MEKVKIEVDKKYLSGLENFGIPYILIKGNSPEGFDYVPSLKLYIAKEKKLHGENWFDTQKALHENGERMPTIPEFQEYLKFAKENKKDIYDKITQGRPSGAEWLDADFKVEGKNSVVYYHVFEGDEIVRKSEVFDKNTLRKDKTPGISLESLLTNSTAQGLPKKSTKDGDLYYWAPMDDNNSVAWFDANSVRAYLGCGRNPSDGGSGLGARAVRCE